MLMSDVYMKSIFRGIFVLHSHILYDIEYLYIMLYTY